MEIETLEKLRIQWYSNKSVMMNIIDAMKLREGAFLQLREGKKDSMMRYLKINHDIYFYKNAERYGFFNHKMNLYNSLAKLPNMPMFPFNRIKKEEQTTPYCEDQYFKDIISYDFMLDIDAKEIEKDKGITMKSLQFAYHEFVEIKKLFDEYEIPYWCQFSGKKGFHLRVDSVDYPIELKKMGVVKQCNLFKKVIENIGYIRDYRFPDDSIFDLKRIAKTPYSVTYPLYLIAYPLTDKEIESFNLKMVSLPYRLSKVKDLFQRRTCKREGDPEGFMKFLRRYEKL